jgi:DNA processing protein
VLGSGLGKIYPSENRDLADKIACHGAVLSEFPVDYPPSPQTFPYRNRIVAGLGRGILVVEAGLTSGALITANLALDYGRQIFSVPGPVDKATSRGTNQLIQDGAKLATCAEDILDELEYLLPPALGLSQANGKQNDPTLTAAETCILRTLAGGELDAESLVEHTKLSVADLSSALLSLELKNRIKILPGGWYRIL